MLGVILNWIFFLHTKNSIIGFWLCSEAQTFAYCEKVQLNEDEFTYTHPLYQRWAQGGWCGVPPFAGRWAVAVWL